jgi:hypothetical protein
MIKLRYISLDIFYMILNYYDFINFIIFSMFIITTKMYLKLLTIQKHLHKCTYSGEPSSATLRVCASTLTGYQPYHVSYSAEQVINLNRSSYRRSKSREKALIIRNKV